MAGVVPTGKIMVLSLLGDFAGVEFLRQIKGSRVEAKGMDKYSIVFATNNKAAFSQKQVLDEENKW